MLLFQVPVVPRLVQDVGHCAGQRDDGLNAPWLSGKHALCFAVRTVAVLHLEHINPARPTPQSPNPQMFQDPKP